MTTGSSRNRRRLRLRQDQQQHGTAATNSITRQFRSLSWNRDVWSVVQKVAFVVIVLGNLIQYNDPKRSLLSLSGNGISTATTTATTSTSSGIGNFFATKMLDVDLISMIPTTLRSGVAFINKSNNKDDDNINTDHNPVNIPNNTLTEDSHPVYCFNTTWCCGHWTVNADSWWIHKPHWQVILEDDVGFCFTPLNSKAMLPHYSTKQAAAQSPHRIQLLERLHWVQWNINISSTNNIIADEQSGDTDKLRSLAAILPTNYNFSVNCSNVISTTAISSGYGASLQWLYSTFWRAYTEQRPYQMTKRGPWLYLMDMDPNKADDFQKLQWAYCPDRDISCLYLAVSPCSRYDIPEQEKLTRRPDTADYNQVMEWLWLREYMTRPKQAMRYEWMQLRRPYERVLAATANEPDGGCIALHVRRGDAGVPRVPFRRYAAIAEYLQLIDNDTEIPEWYHNTTRTIFLLTDDQSTIDEVHRHYINSTDNPTAGKYKWVYTNKLRGKGPERGFNGHIPLGSNGPSELLYVVMEQDLAARYCRTLVHGTSGYAGTLLEKMKVYGTNRRRYYLDTQLPREQVVGYQGKPYQLREAHLMKQVRAVYENSTTTN